MDWFAALDPTIAYLGLIIALWSVVTIVYTPGTIIGEVLSTVLTVATLVALVQQPTRWLAVVLVIVGVAGFLAMPFMSLRYARYADLGLVLQAVGGFLLFEGRSVSPLIIVLTILLAWVYHRYLLMPILRHHQTAAVGDEGQRLVGTRGRVTRAIDPLGTVYVGGEMWTARSTEAIPLDTDIVVLEKVGLELRVEKAKRDDPALHVAGKK